MSLSNPDSQLYYLSKKQLFNTHLWKKKANPIYLKSCEFFGALLIDRTETIDAGIDFKIIDQIPNETNTDLSFSKICDIRAAGITSSAKGKLKVLWSGGIDSTVALISLIKDLTATDDIDRLNVLLSKESIIEYPGFFKDVIKDKLNYEIIQTCIIAHISADEVIISGEHGDQLFGSDKLKYSIITGDAYSPYTEILDFIITRKLGTYKYTNRIIDFIEPQLKKSPIEIITLFDYLWWLNFSLKWQTVSMRLVHGINRNHYDLESTVFHFFKSENFQKWSMSNHKYKIKKEWNSYKYVAKEYIYQFHPDDFYLIKKEKEQSLKEVLVNSDTKLGFMKRFNMVKSSFSFQK
ncbi:hypothetical protein [Aquimarina sp. RZ0]|uniref:hypothetical protein n=1 Tax=Aquimarina sp. RZ0 TaxID=2607730 RepID=UPI0011F11890|nr:hypothetical protein [Aquimarina sp. RZ0]KAA1248031.1 hypothetical protein F0000_00095 [Aquimarina sp. RZ0]